MTGRSDRRGFSLIIVLIVVALLAVLGTIVLSMVTNDEQILGAERMAKEARFGAEGAAMEILNDDDLPTMLPSYASSLKTTYLKSNNSAFNRPATQGQAKLQYDATIALVRDTAVLESSLTVTRAFLYEVNVESRSNGGEASDEVNVEIYKVFTMPAGTVLPDLHSR